MSLIATSSNLFTGLDGRILVSIASLAAYFVYHRYEPAGVLPALGLLVAVPGLLSASLRGISSTILGTIVVIFPLYWSLLVLVTVAYRISPFHPLARYPGPLLCKISKGRIAYLVARYGKAHIYVQELHEKYGEVVRIGPNELSISHKDMSTAVLGAKGLPRGPYYDTREHEAGVSLDGLRDPALHTIRRKPWARGMNSTAMKYYEDLVRSQVGELARAFHQREGEKVDISAWMTFFGFDFMGHMAFSYGFGMLQNGRDVHGLSDLIERALTEAAWISHVPWSIPFLGYIPGGSTSWEEMKVAGEQAVKRRVDGGSIHPDLFHYLMDEDGVEPIKPSLETCAIDGQLAIIAGSDTAATALAHLWYFLLSQPQCYNRLRKEVDDAFPPGEDSLMDLARQGAMPYLNACINESLRLYPPVLTGLQRRVVSGTGGRMVGPHFVPDGTQVAAWAYSIHRDPKHFSPLPNAFWPDRWLSQEKFVLPSGEAISQDQVITERDVFLPFSLGPMVCAGKNVAMTEMRAVVCAVMQQFDIEIADRSCVDSWEDDVHEIFVTSRGTLPVLLKSRSLPTLI